MEKSQKEVKYLTGIRGVAVLLVLFAHMLPNLSFNKSIAYLGMSLFFILSGCVLTYTWGERFNSVRKNSKEYSKTCLHFLWARLARLGPLYLLVGIPYFASAGLDWGEISYLIPRYLLGMQSWFFDANVHGSIKQLLVYAMTWSISAEVFLYLLFPIFIFCFYYFKQKTLWIIVLTSYLIYCVALTILVNTKMYTGLGYPPSQTVLDWFVYLSPYGRIFEFLMGMLVGMILCKRNQAATGYGSLYGVCFAAFIIYLVVQLTHVEANNQLNSTIALFRMGPLFTLPLCGLMLALAKGNDLLEKLFSTKVLLSIGVWSYSIYLLQGYGIPFFGQNWLPGISTIIKYITNFFVIMLLCSASYRSIEVTSRRFLLNLDPVSKLFAYLDRRRAQKIDVADVKQT